MTHVKSQMGAHLTRKIMKKTWNLPEMLFKKCLMRVVYCRMHEKNSTKKFRYLTKCILHFKMLLGTSNKLTAVKEGVSDFWLSADMLLSPFCSSKIPKRMFFLSSWMWLSHMLPAVKILPLTETVWIAALHKCQLHPTVRPLLWRQ